MLPKNFMEAAKLVQEELKKTKEDFDNKVFNFEYQNSQIKLEILGNKKITKLDIDNSLLKDKNKLETFLISSINDAYITVNKEFEKLIITINDKYAPSFDGMI